MRLLEYSHPLSLKMFRFYDVGYKDGAEHGRVHGLIEGRALGKEKGFEMWEEVGFYLGFATTWTAILEMQQEPKYVPLSCWFQTNI